jgi:hypothetical protein
MFATDWYFLGEPIEDGPQIEATQLLASIISQPEGNAQHFLEIELDDQGGIQSLIRRSSKDQQIISKEELLTREVVLARAGGKDALLLTCQDCTTTAGGVLILRYLNNGISNSYQRFWAKLGRDAAGAWILSTHKDVQIHRLTLVSRKILGRLVGIERIDVN